MKCVQIAPFATHTRTHTHTLAANGLSSGRVASGEKIIFTLMAAASEQESWPASE